MTTSTPASRRELFLITAFALWGVAIAVGSIAILDRPAPPDQEPGLAKIENFDAKGPWRWMVTMIVTPFLLAFALRPLARRLARGQVWAAHAVLASVLVTLWLASIHRDLWWTTLPCAAVVAVCVLLRDRDLRFTRHDIVLLPVLMTALLAAIDVMPRFGIAEQFPVALLVVFAVRVAVTFVPAPLPPALAFLAAPLGLVLQTGFFARDQRYFGWHAMAMVVVTPFLVRLFLRNRRRAVRLLVFVIFPLALFAYWNAISMMTAEGKPRIHFFEDSHALLPASEYVRGERPYRDILPGHGLIEDGGFDALVFATGEVNAGRAKKAREVVGTLMAFALYALAWAVTGSPRAAFLAGLFAIMTGIFTSSIRVLPYVVALALIAGAVRWRRPRWFLYAGVATVLCGATSLDYGAYTFLTLVVASLRARVYRWPLIGIAAGAIPLFAGLAAFGILDDFIRGTFVEIPAVSDAYALGFLDAPVSLAQRLFFPDVLGVLLEPRTMLYVIWPMMVVFTAVMILRRWPRRIEPVVILGVWATLSGLSYAERHHRYFATAFVVMFVLLAMRARRHRAVLVLAALVLATPTIHLAVVGTNREMRGPAAEWVAIDDVPRARGALWHVSDAAAIASVKKYLSLALAPDETFLDLTNSGAYHFLFARDCPIREYEVAFFQSEEKQREVIRRLESNPKIRAVLMPATPHGRFTVDVPNAQRAPLVFEYVTEHFQPDFEEGEIVFWRRR